MVKNIPFGIEEDNVILSHIVRIANSSESNKLEAQDILYSLRLVSLYEKFNSQLSYSPGEFIAEKMSNEMRRWYMIKYQGGFDECPSCCSDDIEENEDGTYFCKECEEVF